MRNLRRRSQEFLSGGKKSSKSAEKAAKATQPAQSQAEPKSTTSVAPQLPATTSTMNGAVETEEPVPSYLLTGKVAVVTGSGERHVDGNVEAELTISRAWNGRRNGT